MDPESRLVSTCTQTETADTDHLRLTSNNPRGKAQDRERPARNKCTVYRVESVTCLKMKWPFRVITNYGLRYILQP
jgi:hypothetical protein